MIRHLKTPIAALTACLLLLACKHPTAFKEVQSKNGSFLLQVPTYMSASNSIFPDISQLEYRNDSIPLYVVGLDTSRDGLFEASLRQFYDSAEAHPSVDSAVFDKPVSSIVNGDSAINAKLTGSVNGEKFIYHIETLATNDKFYYILIWTKATKDKDLSDDIDKILKSFHDMKQGK